MMNDMIDAHALVDAGATEGNKAEIGYWTNLANLSNIQYQIPLACHSERWP